MPSGPVGIRHDGAALQVTHANCGGVSLGTRRNTDSPEEEAEEEEEEKEEEEQEDEEQEKENLI